MCIFCKISNHEAPSSVVYENDSTIAFMDLGCLAEGHVLVIPKKHAENIFDISEDDAAEVMKTTVKVAKAIKETLKPEGMTIFQCNGEAGGQAVFHLHVHLVPRNKGDGFVCNGSYKQPPVEQLSKLAEKIKLRL